MKNFLLSLPFILLSIGINAQAGAHVHGGILGGAFQTATLTPDGESHTGFRIGIDARLNAGRMFFSGGVHYSKFAFDPSVSADFFKPGDSFSVQKARFGLGWHLFTIPRVLKLRAKAMGSVNLISEPKNRSLPEPYERMNEGYASIDLGVGVDVLFMTIDFEYEIGMLNAVNEAPDSKINMWTLTAGFFF